jgi:hypothetical protein
MNEQESSPEPFGGNEPQVVFVEAECPYCGSKANYRISIQAIHVAAFSIWNRLWIRQFYVFVPFLLGLFFLKDGWRVLGLTVILALVIILFDWLVALSFSILAHVVANLMKIIRRLGEKMNFRGEISVQPCRVVLPCSNPNCSNSARKFLVTLTLPIAKQGHNDFRITDVRISV